MQTDEIMLTKIELKNVYGRQTDELMFIKIELQNVDKRKIQNIIVQIHPRALI